MPTFWRSAGWFYSVYALTLLIDLGDSYMKGGWPYLRSLGVLALGLSVFGIPVTVIGWRSTRIRTHAIMGAIYLARSTGARID